MKDKRMNLLELKENLNKLPKEYLENTKLMWDFAVSDEPSEEYKMMTLFSEDEPDVDFGRFKVYEMKEFKDIDRRFIEPLNKDLKQAKIREGEKGWDEEYNLIGDE